MSPPVRLPAQLHTSRLDNAWEFSVRSANSVGCQHLPGGSGDTAIYGATSRTSETSCLNQHWLSSIVAQWRAEGRMSPVGHQRRIEAGGDAAASPSIAVELLCCSETTPWARAHVGATAYSDRLSLLVSSSGDDALHLDRVSGRLPPDSFRARRMMATEKWASSVRSTQSILQIVSFRFTWVERTMKFITYIVPIQVRKAWSLIDTATNTVVGRPIPVDSSPLAWRSPWTGARSML